MKKKIISLLATTSLLCGADLDSLQSNIDGFGGVTHYTGNLSGFYSNAGMVTPQNVVLHNFNPEGGSRVAMGFKKNVEDALWNTLKEKWSITDEKPMHLGIVFQRQNINFTQDVDNMRPHYGMFTDIQPGDTRLNGNYDGVAPIVSSKIQAFPFSDTSLSLANIEANLTAHNGGGTTVLSGNSYIVQGFTKGQSKVFFSYFKTGDVTVNGAPLEASSNKGFLTLHFLMGDELQIVLDDILENLRKEDRLPNTITDYLKMLDHAEIFQQSEEYQNFKKLLLGARYESVRGAIAQQLMENGQVSLETADHAASLLGFE